MTQIDEAVAISLVSSWLMSISDRSREALLNTVSGWEQLHTDMLITEVGRKLEGASVLVTGSWDHVTDAKLSQALTALSSTDRPPQLSALFSGLLLIDG